MKTFGSGCGRIDCLATGILGFIPDMDDDEGGPVDAMSGGIELLVSTDRLDDFIEFLKEA
jgi:hypothetical protein